MVPTDDAYPSAETAGPSEGAEMKQEVFLPDDYRPAEDEPFMNERHDLNWLHLQLIQ